MKTKTEIRNKITQINQQKKLTKLINNPARNIYIQLINQQILALKWVLGYKIQPTYFCPDCLLAHKGLTCPRCNNTGTIQP